MKLTKFAALTLLGLLLATAVKAQGYLLTVDVSNPHKVIFTATTNYAALNDRSRTPDYGVNLLLFFTSSISGSSISTSGTLIGGNAGTGYDHYIVDSSFGSYINLNLYGDPSTFQSFTTNSPAFTGSLTTDMSHFTSQLPLPGATGNIRSGNEAHPGPVIGQWEVLGGTPVPEPGMLALAVLGGVVALIFVQCRRK